MLVLFVCVLNIFCCSQSYCDDPDLVLELKNLIVIFADTLQVGSELYIVCFDQTINLKYVKQPNGFLKPLCVWLQGYGFPVNRLFDLLFEVRDQYNETLLKKWSLVFRCWYLPVWHILFCVRYPINLWFIFTTKGKKNRVASLQKYICFRCMPLVGRKESSLQLLLNNKLTIIKAIGWNSSMLK